MFSAVSASAQTCQSTGSPDPAYFNTSSGNASNTYKLKVYFHLVYNSAGTNGYPKERLFYLKQRIEDEFRPLGIFFEFDCEVNIIKNNFLANDALQVGAESMKFCEYGEEISKFDGLNIFICSGEQIGGFNGKVNTIPATYLVINGGMTSIESQYKRIESSTVIHELGHALGLLHMYHGYVQTDQYQDPSFPGELWSESCYDCETNSIRIDLNECAETISTGTTCGDLIADTPPSHPRAEFCDYVPSPTGFFDEVYSLPNVKDPDGVPYFPALDNFMSLADTCRKEFSTDQITVMKNHIESHPILQPFRIPTSENFCDCFLEDPIIIDSPVLWSSLVASESLPPIGITSQNFIINDDIVIDIDYAFSDCEFLIADGVSITVRYNTEVDFDEGCDFRSCSTWEGITVENPAMVSFADCSIADAITGIKAYSAFASLTTDLSLSNTTFKYCDTGLDLRGNINMIDFSGNRFFDLNLGVRFADGLVLDLNADAKATLFTNLNTGIEIINASAFVEGNIFINMTTGISVDGYITNIADNQFYDISNAVILRDCFASSLYGNQIGTPNTPVERGIQMTNVTGSMVSFNDCHATTVGIQGELVNAEINNNIISTTGGFNQNSGGIRLTMANECDIHSNDIYANGGTFGIEMIDGFTNTIRDNHNVAISGSNQNRAAAIRLLASTDEVVKSNWTDSYNTHKGIIAQNSGANTFDCNVVQQSTEALHIVANSEQQMVSGNKFYTSTTDLLIESVIGVQDNEANEFRGGNALALGLNTDEIFESRVLVDQLIPFHMPTDPNPTNGWFVDDPSEPYICSEVSLTHPGLPTFTNAATLCDYYNSIKPQYTTNPRLYFIKVYHLLKYAKVKNSVTLPSCITADPTITRLCGLLDMVDHTTKITKTTAVDSSDAMVLKDYAELRHNLSAYNESRDRNTKDQLKTGIDTKIEALRPAVLVEIRNDSIRLDSIEQVLRNNACVDSLAQNWTTSYRQMLKWLQGGKLTPQDSTSLHSIAMQCSDNYGDGIHVARAIMGQYSNVYYDVYDDCASATQSQAVSRSIANSSQGQHISIYPNPSVGAFVIDFGESQSGHIEVYTVQGKLLTALDYIKANTANITIEDFSGMLIIRVEHEGQSPLLKRAIIVQ